MGESLERVQYKFASIIGELCNEPDVLSLFAVWLDLRLAEYKLKGNISLDCSGEEPDPIWLKGLNKGKARRPSQTGTLGSSPSQSRTSQNQPSNFPSQQKPPKHLASSHYFPSQQITESDFSTTQHTESSSPEVVVVVKEEAQDVYPVELNYNTETQNSETRKRLLTDSQNFGDGQWSTPNKQRRFSQAGSTESPSNQSLMSVISGYQGNSQESDSKGDNSSYILPSTSSMVATDLNTDSFTDASFNTSQSTFADSSWGNPPGSSIDTGSANVAISAYSTLDMDSHSMFGLQGDVYARSEILQRKMRINPDRLKEIPVRTVASTVAAVGVFERWLWNSYPNERRSFTEIPPIELNRYLADFLTNVTMPNGTEYKRGSFKNLMSNLARYMKETKYPIPLKNSEIFFDAVKAYIHRRKNLKP